MKIKKTVFFIAILSMIIISCSKDDIITDKPNTDPKPPDSKPSIDISNYFVSVGEGDEDVRALMDCVDYSDDIIKAINDSLSTTVKKAPTKRDKVLAAANFLVSFKTSVPYAYETGGEDYKLVARYTRKGFFLKDVVENGYTYPAWGCEINTSAHWLSRGVKNLGHTFKNGLHCSSFIGWCLYNAGVANASLLDKTWADDYRTFPLSKEKVLKDALDLIQPGDLLWFTGHVAIVLAVEGDTVLFAESAIWGNNHIDSRNGARWRIFDKKTTNFNTFRFKSLIQMSGVYE